MKKIISLILSICIISMFVISIIYYQQQTGRVLNCILGCISIFLYSILSYLDVDYKLEIEED